MVDRFVRSCGIYAKSDKPCKVKMETVGAWPRWPTEQSPFGELRADPVKIRINILFAAACCAQKSPKRSWKEQATKNAVIAAAGHRVQTVIHPENCSECNTTERKRGVGEGEDAAVRGPCSTRKVTGGHSGSIILNTTSKTEVLAVEQERTNPPPVCPPR